MARESYNHKDVEASAQKKWAEENAFETNLEDASKPPYYLLFEFPYPSGDLHIGHWFAYAITDIYARMKRMQGANVLFPIGFDAFGLPAENAAIRNSADPKEWTLANIERMRAQIKSMGTSLDWSKEVITCDPEYYRWTQWLFTKLFEHQLAERRNAPVKWCPKDLTVLANEQVIDGKCERCDTPVEEKVLTQWFFKITDYAKRLHDDLEGLPWREDIKEAQRAWIGESEGAKIPFSLVFKRNPSDNDNRGPNGERAALSVFTTRPDTIFGATYLVIAPEHPWITLATDESHDVLDNKSEVIAYLQETKKKTERERSENKEKTGVELMGVKAINPATNEEIPLYVADYVLGSYGTGAVMAVPSHDERDFEFAKKHGLSMRTVIEPKFVADTAGDSAIQPGQEIVRREAVSIIVRNPKDDTFLCNSWKTERMNGLFTGGVDEGEDAVEAARREILEETGYKNLRHIDRPELFINTFFYHRVKKQNRWAHFRYVFFELENEEREPVAEAESALHEIVWKKRDELRDFFTVFEGDFIVDHLDGAPFCFTGDGILVHSGEFSGKDSREALWDITAYVGGERVTNYRIRDWLISRQRYWGCPIPVVYDPEGNPHPIPGEHLPWLLPTDVSFAPTNEAPLASSTELKERVRKIFGEGWTPEYDTLDTFVDSSWYFLRYLAPHDTEQFSNPSRMKKWLPINRYSGGSEHTTMHLLYARFFQKALYDLALVPTQEPFIERFNRGIILGPDGAKMSKSKGNVVNPDEFVEKYGADSVRLYLAFIGPYNESGHYPWNLDGVASMRRFTDRVYSLSSSLSDAPPSQALETFLAKTVHKVESDSERFKFNTAISALMILLNELEALDTVPKSTFRTFITLLAPFSPHLAEHLWEKMGEAGGMYSQAWPTVNPELLVEETRTVVVQIRGKKKGEITLSKDTQESDALAAAMHIPAVAALFENGALPKVVYVPGRIINLVPP